MIVFNAEDHSYKSVDDNKINWISVTTLVSYFKNAFDANAVAKKVSKNIAILRVDIDTKTRVLSGIIIHNNN